MKKILLIFILMFGFILPVKADSINQITMDIYLDKEGTAHITENWDVNIKKGTEGYKPYYNLGNSVISNFEVYNQEGTKFNYNSNWNVNGSFNDKAYQNGINYLSDGVELCWGISKYGKNLYTLKYDISGFVADLADKQMIYWTLIPYELSLKPKDIKIVIRSDAGFDDNIAVWGYGNYGGTAYVYDRKIEMNSDGTLGSDEYMTILVELPKGMFATNNIISGNFNEYHNMAEEGAVHYEENNGSNLFSTLSRLFSFIFIIGVCVSIVKSSYQNNNFKKTISKGKFHKDLNYFRDIPCDKNIFYAFFLANSYNLAKKDNDFLGALILTWIRKGYVKIELKEKKGIIKTNEETSLVMDISKFNENVDADNLESKMFRYMHEASKDGVLESKEFEKYCKTNYSKVLDWFKDVKVEQKNNCVNKNLLIKPQKLFSNYVETPEIYEEAKKLVGLKKFLNEFSSIDEKSAIEVQLWEYYLVYAQIFGIGDKVASEFKKLYPDMITDLSYTYEDIIFINAMSYRGVNSASSARSRAQSYSSGGGGFSSGGGGGGSFGGGGGGGGFR